MHWKTTVLLLVVTVGVGAYISLHELRQPSPEEREQLAKQIVDLHAASVTQVTVQMPQAHVTLIRDGTFWRLGDQKMRADVGLVNQLVSAVSPLMAQRTLTGTSQQPLTLASFGLEPAVGSITLMAGGTPTTLWFGETTAVGENRYLKASGRPEVFVVSSSLFDAANRPVDQFRDPSLLRFDPWSAQQLTVTSPAATFTLVRNEDAWRLTQPIADQADRAEVNSLLNRFSRMRIQRVVDDAPRVEQLADWGFDQPAAEFAVTLTDPAASLTVFIGRTLPDDASLRYAKRFDEPTLYAVSAADVDAVLRDPQGLRAKAASQTSASPSPAQSPAAPPASPTR